MKKYTKYELCVEVRGVSDLILLFMCNLNKHISQIMQNCNCLNEINKNVHLMDMWSLTLGGLHSTVENMCVCCAAIAECVEEQQPSSCFVQVHKVFPTAHALQRSHSGCREQAAVFLQSVLFA